MRIGRKPLISMALLSLLLAGCDSAFTTGAYVDPRYGTVYEFDADGGGRVIGGVPGQPAFRYEVKGNEVVTSGAVTLRFRVLDERTIERPDGTRFVLRADGEAR
jgi:hypothetical protein